MFQHLIPADNALFFSRNDPDDLRMGELTGRDPDSFPGEAHIVLIGVPQDIGVRRNGGRPGAANGPDAIRSMLYRLTPYNAETGESIPKGFLFDAGNLYCYGDLEEIHGRLEETVKGICEAGLIPLVLGGGHDITYAAASGAYERYGKLGIFNFDAHLDVRPAIPQRNSGTSFRMLIEEGKLDPARFVEFGIQPFTNAQSHVEWLTSQGGIVRTLNVIQRVGIYDAMTASLRIAAPEGTSLYGTLDIDGVRSADAPGVSAPMPDGFSSSDFLATARTLGKHPSCVALDIVEMNPAFDIDNRTAKLAAHGAIRFIAAKAERG